MTKKADIIENVAEQEKRSIVHMDLDCYFVSVSRLLNPSLNNKPVIVGGGERGVVAACSYESRKYGVHSAMPVKQALRLCPEAILVRGDYDEYSKRSDEITQIIKEKVPLYERSSIDEFYIDLTGMDKFHGCYRYASELRQTIIKETGLPISFGMSANKTVSKVATEEAKPNNQLKIDFGEERNFLAPLSVKKIPMVGEKTYQLLRTMGVERVKTLQEMPPELLQHVLGDNGISIWKKANGIDTSPVVSYSEQKSIGQEETFETDTIDLIKLTTCLVTMAEKIGFRLRSQNKLAGCVTVKIRYSNFDTHSMQCRISYTNSDHILIQNAKDLFSKLFQRRLLIRLVGLKVSHLVGGGHQVSLFEDKLQLLQLYQSMDRMRILYGGKAIQRAIGVSNAFRSFNPFNGTTSSPEKEKKSDFEYLIVAVLPKNIRKRIEQEQHDLRLKHKISCKNKTQDYLLLARFNCGKTQEDKILEALEKMCMFHFSFAVDLCGYGIVNEDMLSIQIKKSKNMLGLIKALKIQMEQPSSTSIFYFQPFLLLAENITRTHLPSIQKHYEKRVFSDRFILQNIQLLRRVDEYDTPIEIRDFEFRCFSNTDN